VPGKRRDGDLDALQREVQALRVRVSELQRRAARHQDTDDVSLAEREELLREAERSAHVGTWTYDLGSGRVTWSDELYRILGHEPGSLPPTVDAFFAAIHADDRVRAQRATEQAIRDGILPLVDCRVVRPDGSIRHTTHSSSMLFDGEGTVRRMVGSVVDRTETLAVENKLRRTLALLEEAQRFAQLGSWRFDPRTGELEWSLEFRRIAGLDPSVAPDADVFLERVVPEDRGRFKRETEHALASGGKVDARLRRPNGELRHIRVEAFQVQTAEGQSELRGTLVDVTDQLRMREELAHAQKMEAVGRLAGGIAHDFNNLLTVITGNLELLEARIGPAPELQDSRRALSSAASLTGRLLAFGRKAQLSLKVVDPNELVSSTMALMRRLVGDEVHLETELTPGLPRVRVDSLEIERALVNLVVNARDAMPGGGVVRIRTGAQRAAGALEVELTVEDQGPGIAEADRARIFEPFYTTRGDTGGTGLGLATVQGTAEQHGGRVRVTDRPGGGSVFTIVLPAVDSRDAAEARALPAEPAKGVTRPLQLLVVDDESMIANLIQRILERRGHKVWVTTQPQQAITLWAERGASFDLVICDVAMANMRGPELIERLSEVGNVPCVLFVTGYSEEAVKSELGHPVLTKPFTAEALCRAIGEAVC
jgi:PAS domain S-box-containing protein